MRLIFGQEFIEWATVAVRRSAAVGFSDCLDPLTRVCIAILISCLMDDLGELAPRGLGREGRSPAMRLGYPL